MQLAQPNRGRHAERILTPDTPNTVGFAAGSGARFIRLVRDTDAEREWAYDRKSDVGKLDKALDEANARGWTVVSMKAIGKLFSRNEPNLYRPKEANMKTKLAKFTLPRASRPPAPPSVTSTPSWSKQRAPARCRRFVGVYGLWA